MVRWLHRLLAPPQRCGAGEAALHSWRAQTALLPAQDGTAVVVLPALQGTSIERCVPEVPQKLSEHGWLRTLCLQCLLRAWAGLLGHRHSSQLASARRGDTAGAAVSPLQGLEEDRSHAAIRTSLHSATSPALQTLAGAMQNPGKTLLPALSCPH